MTTKTTDDNRFFGHPAGLQTLFLTEMWERMSYYGMRALLVLFMTASIQEEGLAFTVATATAIYGLYTGAVYFMGLPGGWMADRLIGGPQSRMVRRNHYYAWPYCIGHTQYKHFFYWFDTSSAWYRSAEAKYWRYGRHVIQRHRYSP